MPTTQLFVELLITGLGGLLWITIFICSICGINMAQLLDHNISSFFIIPLSGFAYVLGILIDRSGYQLFEKFEKGKIPDVFDNKDDYPKKEEEKTDPKPLITYIMHQSTHLKDQMMYNRTRLRLCRSWILNFFLLACALFSYYLTQNVSYSGLIVILSVLATLFCLCALVIWNTLAKDYYKNIKSSYDILKEGKWAVTPTAESQK